MYIERNPIRKQKTRRYSNQAHLGYGDHHSLQLHERKTQPKSEELESGINYYNYLSPVSINSPSNSPLDLTLNNTIKLESTISNYDFMGQNSEVILLHDLSVYGNYINCN
jgi:hypothetical protein